MSKKIVTFLILLVSLTNMSCTVIAIGAGAGMGAVIYNNGEVKHNYQASFDDAIRACINTMIQPEYTLTDQYSDGLKAVLKAKSQDGTPVSINVKTIAPKITQVGIRTGMIGVWDKNTTELIHARISRQLQK